MRLRLVRYSSGLDDTLGLLFIDDKFVCYTLEDEYRAVKVRGETRIPAGNYKLDLRTEGGMHERYSKKFPDMHRGMLWLRAVPDFSFVYLHCGNRDEHTDGCILVGNTSQQNVTEDGFIGESVAAYRRIYPRIVDSLDRRIIVEDLA